ncbi:MAG TPA: class IV adenylate cyclase [Candidatus Nanoarchaeia archaeon]|nr:class IV adenylate cyclase [Candidatus Nanoarchaeia archaeon]
MTITNVEIKARCANPEAVRRFLKERDAKFEGTDHQIDTYFRISKGRLKLRQGNIENSLIFYDRKEARGPKTSEILLARTLHDPGMREILAKVLEETVTVDKHREIYFIDNVKFHIDEVKGLGNFVEIEAIDRTGELGIENISDQCREFMRLLKIEEKDCIDKSYSDMLLRQ